MVALQLGLKCKAPLVIPNACHFNTSFSMELFLS